MCVVSDSCQSPLAQVGFVAGIAIPVSAFGLVGRADVLELVEEAHCCCRLR